MATGERFAIVAETWVDTVPDQIGIGALWSRRSACQ